MPAAECLVGAVLEDGGFEFAEDEGALPCHVAGPSTEQLTNETKVLEVFRFARFCWICGEYAVEVEEEDEESDHVEEIRGRWLGAQSHDVDLMI